MFSDTPDFKAWFPEVDGFPRPDWKAIRQWIRVHVTPDHLDASWQEIARIWLEKTCERLDGAYTTAESENFYLLSELDAKRRKELLAFLEETRAGMLHALADIPLPKRYGKHAVLRFTKQDDYYRYISLFHSDGSYPTSGGIFIRGSGYMHIAYPHDDCPDADRATLVHELSHNLLYFLPLPVWLSEGLAMLFECDIGARCRILVTKELAAKHTAYWNAQTIQEFWRGASFLNPDGQELAYALARILLDFIVTDLQPSPANFREFVLHANSKDAGEAAALDYLGMELNDLVSAFLGPGEWTPHLN